MPVGGKARHWVRRVHMWMGLSAGLLFALLGLTGGVLAFYPEIDVALHPVIQEQGRADAASYDRAMTTLRAAYPDKSGAWRLEVTGQAGAIPARYYNPPERAEHAFRPMMVWLSADGARVVRRDYWGEYAVTFIYDLHYRLAMGDIGAAIVGWGGFGVLALLLTGVWAWWPRGSWAKALRIKRGAPAIRALRDWHKVAGLSGLVFLILLTGTGIMLALPKETQAVMTVAGLPHDPPPAPPKISADMPILSPAAALSNAASALPDARVAWIETPASDAGFYRIRMNVPGDPSARFPHSFVWVHPYTGQVLAVQDARAAGMGSTIANWLHPLHDGSAAGLLGRILVALSGLIPLFLFVTGYLRWRRIVASVLGGR